MNKKLIATLALAVAGAFGCVESASACASSVGNATDGVEEVITVDTTWGAGAFPSPVCLEEPIFVSSGARLTILPGTIVRGQARRGAVGSVDDNPGALIITAGAQIDANGTATAPIVMTTAAVDNDDDGVCDDLDGDGFLDPWPGFDPTTCPACTPDATPEFCDDEPLTAPLAPLNAAGFANVQLWGGVVLAGCAPTNVANDGGAPVGNVCDHAPGGGDGYGQDLIEGVQLPGINPNLAVYGGSEAHDNTGIFRYVSVRHAGDPLTEPGDELNGVTIAGVGDGTIYEFIEVYTNWDDGHEFFGGTVNGNHLVTLYAGDDQFDIDQGYTGALQYLFTAMPFFTEENTFGGSYGSGSGDNMGEWDGVDGGNVNVRRDAADGDTNNAPWPFPAVNIWNLTGIGSVPDGPNPSTSPRGAANGLSPRAGFAGSVHNSIVVNTGGSSCFLPLAGGAPVGYDAVTNTANDLVRLVASICADTGAPDATAVANGDAWAERECNHPTDCDNITTAADVLVQEDPQFGPRGDVDGKLRSTMQGGAWLPYDPRPTGADIGPQPQDTGLDRAATFRGAFEGSGAVDLWTTPWTAGNIGGILAD